MTDDTSKQRQLLDLLSGVEEQATDLEQLGRDVTRAARVTRDVASCVQLFASNVPAGFPDDRWDPQFATWRDWQVLASGLLQIRTSVASFVAASETSLSSTSGVLLNMTIIEPRSAPLAQARERFRQIVEQQPLAKGVRDSLNRLSLDVARADHRPATDLLEEALSALSRPLVAEGGPVSVLVPVRECVHVILSELLRRRPNQEPAGTTSAKVCSVGAQCGRVDLTSDHFARLGDDATRLLDDLSRGKQAPLSREELQDLVNKSLLLLSALLDSIDESRLRQPSVSMSPR